MYLQDERFQTTRLVGKLNVDGADRRSPDVALREGRPPGAEPVGE